MTKALVYSDNPALAGEILAFALGAGLSASALAFSEETAQELTKFGADKIYALSGNVPSVESYAKDIANLLNTEGFTIFLVGSTLRGQDLAARTAGYTDWPMISDATVLSVESGTLSTERMVYGGAALLSQVAEFPLVLTLPAGKYEVVIQGDSPIVPITAQPDTRVSLLSTEPIKKEGEDLTVAERVVCVGLGLGKQEDLKIAEDLAQALGAALGCTRNIAEEKHWLPPEQYIGISGVTIKPNLYLALGVSGQIQHVTGVRDAKLIVCVDKNENAPIFKAADYGIVGDLYEIAPLLTAAVKAGA
jgi:electron transfer flavoprotein alpha subunit